MKMLFFECEPLQEASFRTAFSKDQLFFFSEPLNEKTVPGNHSDAEVISVFTSSCVTKKVIDQFPNLAFLLTRSVGCDHIDLDALKMRGILFSNIAHYADRSVAEYAFALIFNLARKINPAAKRTSQEHSISLQGLRGFDLYEKTIGVIGTGNIGSNVIRIAHCLGMKTIAFDIVQNPELKEFGTIYLSLEELLKTADIVSIHVPLTEKTHHLINEQNISLIKKGAYLINTARGGIIQTHALITGLQKNILAGAALDVLEDESVTIEPLQFVSQKHPNESQLKNIVENNYLLNHPHVLITPHNAFNSNEAIDRLTHETIAAIEKFKNSVSSK
ncbi:hydroxyacid dehydrogenase [Candidatus Dependentiae bacterium]|nr:hydroxyacid dehydrogenase [Candidatus Dependentiae bacterium]